MKRIFTIIAAALLTASITNAQAPEKMSYQAVVRDANNDLVKETQIGMQISILQSTADGTAVYVETQTPTTNTNGLATVEIGNGTVVSGDFSLIDWSAGQYFIKTEIDPIGGTDYTITGISQLLSVPYALHAKTADTITGAINEVDPKFTSSISYSISASDTANWNNHTVDTKLDSTEIANMGFSIKPYMALYRIDNGDDIVSADKGYVIMRNSGLFTPNSDIFEQLSNGVKIKKNGFLLISVSQPILSTGSYVSLQIEKNDTIIGICIAEGNSQWAGFSITIPVKISENDIIKFYIDGRGNDIRSITSGPWSNYSITWYSE